MGIVFDPEKDRRNLATHGMSLSRAVDVDIVAVLTDDRSDYGEVRYRAFGLLDGRAVCLAFTIREGLVRAISLRRAHAKEYRRHVPEA